MALRTLGKGHICGKCLDNRPCFETTYGVFEYDGPAGRAIRKGKYAPLPEAIDYIAKQTAAHLPAGLMESPPAMIIPVPLHWRRIHQRGFNPPLIIAHAVARALDRPLKSRLLRRSKHTAEQAGLDEKGRKRNLRHAFKCRKHIPGDILIVDDVFTTGTTARAIAQTLKRAGCERIRILCSAYVDPPNTRPVPMSSG